MISFDSRRKEVHRGDWITWEDIHHMDHEALVIEVVSSKWNELPGVWSYTLVILKQDKTTTTHVWDPYVLRECP